MSQPGLDKVMSAGSLVHPQLSDPSVALTLNARVRSWPVKGLAQWSDTNMFVSKYLKHDTQFSSVELEFLNDS